MTSAHEPELTRRLERHGQEHVLRHVGELPPEARSRFLASVAELDLPLIDALGALAREGARPAEVARFEPPDVFRPRRAAEHRAQVRELRRRGEELLASGAVGWLLVAGGQASRLGYEGPKGAFPVGPVSGRSLFEVFARKLLAARARYGVPIPWYVMTSTANDAATRAFFARHEHFGLPASDVVFFQQVFEPRDLDVRPAVMIAVEEAADHVVGLTRAAVPGAESQALETVGAVHAGRGRGCRFPRQSPVSGGQCFTRRAASISVGFLAVRSLASS